MKVLVFDLETSISSGPHGPDFRDKSNDIYTTIFGATPDDISIVHSPRGAGRQLPTQMCDALKTCDVIVGHNLGFDLSYIFKTDAIQNFILRGGRIWDTQVAEYILTAQQHQFSSLSELQAKYLGASEKIDRISKLYKKGVGADKILQASRRCPRLFAMYEKYCYSDGASTLKVFKQQYIKAKNESMLAIVELYNDYLLALTNVTCTGVKLDMIACEKTLQEFNLKHIEYLEQAQECIKPLWQARDLPQFNINSTDHKSALLFGGEVKNTIRTYVGKYKNGNDKYKNIERKIHIDGFKVPKSLSRKTKKAGVYVTDDAVMQNISSKTKNPVLKKYCDMQKEAMMYKKAAKTYVEAFLNLSVDGILHPNFNNTSVVTGRLSSSKPNMQNISKRNKFGKTLHRLFVAPDGWECVQIDFGQLEIWVAALLSQDAQLIDDLKSGLDMHCMRVALMEQCEYNHAVHMCKESEDAEWVSKRTAAKTFSYQRAYGAGVNKLVEFTGLSKEQIESLIEKEEIRYPDSSNLWLKVKQSIEDSYEFSKSCNIPLSQRGRNILGDYELLPIFNEKNDVYYDKENIQKLGFWKSPTGKKYHFPQTGNVGKFGLRRGVTPTIMKNYPMQGTAADIQAATTARILKLLIKHKDKIQMINEVHDSKWFYVKKEYSNLIIPRLQSIIQDIPTIFKERFNLDVPFNFPVDVEIGPNFADMKTFTQQQHEVYK